jgi:hypothetical protein
LIGIWLTSTAPLLPTRLRRRPSSRISVRLASEAAAVVDGRVHREAVDGRNAADEVADRDGAGLGDLRLVDHEDRAGGLGIDATNARARDDDFLRHCVGRGRVSLRGLLRERRIDW